MEKDFAVLNARTLADASVAFSAAIGVPVTAEYAHILSDAVMTTLACWYAERDREFDLTAELLDPEAVTYAFERMKMIAVLAQISAITGVGMEGFGE